MSDMIEIRTFAFITADGMTYETRAGSMWGACARFSRANPGVRVVSVREVPVVSAPPSEQDEFGLFRMRLTPEYIPEMPIAEHNAFGALIIAGIADQEVEDWYDACDRTTDPDSKD